MHIDTNDPKNAHLEIKSIQVGKMTLQIDKYEHLIYRTVRGENRKVKLLRSDRTLIEILDAAVRGSGDLPAPPPPDRTRIEPPTNLVNPHNVNASAGERAEANAQYGRDVAALAHE